MTEAKDFYKETDNEKKAQLFSETVGIGLDKAKVIFFRFVSLYSRCSRLNSDKKLALDRKNAEKMLVNILSAFIRQEKPEWDLSI